MAQIVVVSSSSNLIRQCYNLIINFWQVIRVELRSIRRRSFQSPFEGRLQLVDESVDAVHPID